MDPAVPAPDLDRPPTYSTSKQVQAWFLRRSRDLWKAKSAKLRGELKRLRQRVADIDRSRARWRLKAEGAQQQLQALQAENDRLRAERDAATAAHTKNGRPARSPR